MLLFLALLLLHYLGAMYCSSFLYLNSNLVESLSSPTLEVKKILEILSKFLVLQKRFKESK